MDEAQNPKEDDDMTYSTRVESSGQGSHIQYNAAFQSTTDYYAWNQAEYQMFQYGYLPQAAPPTASPVMNPFQAQLSPSLLSSRLTPVPPTVPFNASNLPSPPLPAQVPSNVEINGPEQAELPSMSPPPLRNLQAPAARRSKYAALDWEKYRKLIEKLYMDDGKPLEEVMKTMAEDHEFQASVKLYKEKFKEWGWCKYLPNEVAQWMVAKGDKRKLEDKKETVFAVGGRVWTLDRVQKSARRVRKDDVEVIAANAPTPFGVTYRTPHYVSDSPLPHSAPSPRTSYNSSRWTPAPASSSSQLNPFKMTWNGHTRADLVILQSEAQKLDHHGNLDDAENMFREALAGLEHLLSPTHEDTNTVAYQLAAFYTRHERMDDADKVLGWMSEKHIERWGLHHKKTAEHVLHVVDLLNSWFRPEDALTFLYQVEDVWKKEQSSNDEGQSTSKRRKFDDQTVAPAGNDKSHEKRLFDNPKTFEVTSDPSIINSQLRSAEAHIKAKDEAIESVLLRLIEQCEKNPGTLGVQNLQARCELIELYQILHREQDILPALVKGKEAFTVIWKSDGKKSKQLMETAVEFAKLLLKAGKDDDVNEVLRNIEEEAVNTFGPDDSRTIWLLMRIGVMFQNEHNWDEAEPRFEQALAASMAAHGDEDGLTKTLEAALENRCYSYLSRESDDFKSILGSNGIIIRPGNFFLGADY